MRKPYTYCTYRITLKNESKEPVKISAYNGKSLGLAKVGAKLDITHWNCNFIVEGSNWSFNHFRRSKVASRHVNVDGPHCISQQGVIIGGHMTVTVK